MININSRTAVLKEITSQNHWRVASTKTFICFVQSVTHGQDRGGRGEREDEQDGSECKLIRGCEQEAASGNGREAEEPQHLKVLNL